MEAWKVFDGPQAKFVVSDGYNMAFNKVTGFMMRWGTTREDDPELCQLGPEIADIEISVNGCPNACKHCYKNNTNVPPTNMTLETFKTIIDKFPPVLTQVALGITGIQTNPDLFPIMEYCREIGVIPNFTLSGIDLTDEYAKEAARLAGAIAVSVYETDKEVCYRTVETLRGYGADQVNIHLMYHSGNVDFVREVIEDISSDPRLEGLNALVLLCLKPKGRGSDYTPLGQGGFEEIVDLAFELGVPIGFDSCSTQKFVRYLTTNKTPFEKEQIMQVVEPCESSLFSIYVNVHGVAFPCSFSEDVHGIPSIDILKAESFHEVWAGLQGFRDTLLSCDRNCPIYDLEGIA